MAGTQPATREPRKLLETLEPRVLMSASVDLVLIDAALPEHDTLVDAVAGARVITYDGTRQSAGDVLRQATSVAVEAGRSISTLSIVAHGREGAFALGDGWIDAQALVAQSEQWAELGQYMAEGAEIRLLGCNVGRGELGRQLVDGLAMRTSADVFASDDTTGLGGDWVLEVATDADEALLPSEELGPFDRDALMAWGHTLPGPMINDGTFTIIESAADGTRIGTPSAVDPEGHPIRYAITSGNDDGAFAINPYTGEISVADGSLLDYETTTQRSIIVEAVDTNVYEDFDGIGTTDTMPDGQVFTNWRSNWGTTFTPGPIAGGLPNGAYNVGIDGSTNRALGAHGGASGDQREISADVVVDGTGTFYMEFDLFIGWARRDPADMRWGGVEVTMTGSADNIQGSIGQTAGTPALTWFTIDTAADTLHLSGTFTGMTPGVQTVTFNFRQAFPTPPGYGGANKKNVIMAIDNIIGDGSASGTPDTATIAINLQNDTSDDSAPAPPPPVEPPAPPDFVPPPINLVESPVDPFEPPDVSEPSGPALDSDGPADLIDIEPSVPGGFDSDPTGGGPDSEPPPPSSEPPPATPETTTAPAEPTGTTSDSTSSAPASTTTESPSSTTTGATTEGSTPADGGSSEDAGTTASADSTGDGMADATAGSGDVAATAATGQTTAAASSLDVGAGAAPPPWADDPSAAPRTVALEQVMETKQFFEKVDETTEEAREEEWEVQAVTVGSSVTVSAGLSAGYLIWCLQGSSLATSLITALPMWRFFDPLSIVDAPKTPAAGAEAGKPEDEEDLESLVGKGKKDG